MSDWLLLVSVGNTRTRFAMVRGGELEPSRVLDNRDLDALAEAVAAHQSPGETEPPPVLMASVNGPVADAIAAAIESRGRRCSRLGPGASDLPIPIAHTLDDATTVGHDRLLDALGAFSRAKQACIVIDAGTAVTVDFVDGEGTFHGGAIAPGVRMMCEALHEKTAALPMIATPAEALPPEGEPPFGRSTAPAIAVGVVSAVRGMAHLLIDQYAQFYGAYPRVIATGGDAPMLFENDELIEHIVPDLTLVGMLEAFRRLEQLDEQAGQPDAAE